jgi:hypothetical protein
MKNDESAGRFFVQKVARLARRRAELNSMLPNEKVPMT